MANKQVFAFDFDGTLCDGLNECILVTWNGYHDLGLDSFGDDGLRDIPQAFIARFGRLRNFSKHLGHFVVPLLTDASIETQEQFDRAYEAIGEDKANDFVEKTTRYRQAACKRYQEQWLAYHAFYPGVVGFLRSCEKPLYVVTAKDSASVHAILEANSVDIPLHQIFGEQRAKLGALDTIVANERIAKEQLLFFDDNVFNAIEAKRAGYSAYWAGWGYSAPAHFKLASSAGISPVQLDDFLMGSYSNVHAIRTLHDSCV